MRDKWIEYLKSREKKTDVKMKNYISKHFDDLMYILENIHMNIDTMDKMIQNYIKYMKIPGKVTCS